MIYAYSPLKDFGHLRPSRYGYLLERIGRVGKVIDKIGEGGNSGIFIQNISS